LEKGGGDVLSLAPYANDLTDNMKIKIRPYLFIRKAMGDCACLEMEFERITIRQLMQELSGRYGLKFSEHFFDGDNLKTVGGALILVNGRNWRNLPGRLESELKNGDELVLFPPAMGG